MIKSIKFYNDVSGPMINFLINTLEARRSLEFLNYIRETRMIPPLLSAVRLHSLIAERKQYPIMYNDFFIQQSLVDLIIIYKTLGATHLANKMKQELIEINKLLAKYDKNIVKV